MPGRRLVALILIFVLLSPGWAGSPAVASAHQLAGCAQLAWFVGEMTAAGERIDAQDAAGPDMDHVESWSDSDFDKVIAFYDEILVALTNIVPPAIATEFHAVFLSGIELFQELLVTMKSAGVFAMLAYLEPIAELNQRLAALALPLEETCGVAIFDHDEDGQPEVGPGIADDFPTVSAATVTVATVAAPAQSEPIPVGTAGMLIGDWELTVLSVTPDATTEVLAYDPSNTTPEDGLQYFIARVRVTNLEDPSGSSYAPFIDYCGFIPDELTTDTLAPGEPAEGNVCWAIPAAEAASTAALVIFDGDALPNERVYFSLSVPASETGDVETSGGFADAVGSSGEGALSGLGTPESDNE